MAFQVVHLVKPSRCFVTVLQPSNQTGGGGGSSGGMFAAVADLAEGDYDYDDDELESNGYDLNQPKSLDSPITR